MIESELSRLLGVSRIVWLGDGIAGDDTDGHVDDFARFVAPGRVVCAHEPDPDDVNHLPLAASAAQLRREGLEVIELPMPPPIHSSEGDRLPASYANFYIANGQVVVPVFDEPDHDALALDAHTWARARGWALWKALITLANPESDRSRVVESERVLAALEAER